MILEARRGGWRDANKIGLCSPPIETPRGWLTLYHGVVETCTVSYFHAARSSTQTGIPFAATTERPIPVWSWLPAAFVLFSRGWIRIQAQTTELDSDQ